ERYLVGPDRRPRRPRLARDRRRRDAPCSSGGTGWHRQDSQTGGEEGSQTGQENRETGDEKGGQKGGQESAEGQIQKGAEEAGQESQEIRGQETCAGQGQNDREEGKAEIISAPSSRPRPPGCVPSLNAACGATSQSPWHPNLASLRLGCSKNQVATAKARRAQEEQRRKWIHCGGEV